MLNIDNFNNIENNLSKMINAQIGINVLTTFLNDYLLDEVVSDFHSDQREKDENVIAIIQIIQGLNNELISLRQACCDELYRK